MDRFAGMLEYGLRTTGYRVRLLKPQPILGRLSASATGLGKWLGYLDRFLLFIPIMKKATKWADVVHICDQANAVYVPYLYRKPHIVTCHDMLAIRSARGEFSEHSTAITGKIFQGWILDGLRKAHHIACISESTHDDLLRLSGIAPYRVSTNKIGLNYPYRPMSKKESSLYLNQLGLSDCSPFFLHVGNNNWYKNKIGLLKIFQQLFGIDELRRPKLVLAGMRLEGKIQSFADKIGMSSYLRQVAEVSNEQLRALYSTAEGLIFPSLAEGFGWPIIEAQACGCPVFTSNRKPMTEVGGNAAIYFDPSDEFSAAKSISKTIRNNSNMRMHGYNNAIKFSTKKMISGYIDCYRLILSRASLKSSG